MTANADYPEAPPDARPLEQPTRMALRFTALDVCLADVSSDERRATIARIVTAFDGLGAYDKPKGRADAYALAIGDGEPPWFRSAYVLTRPATNSNASSCGLVCRRVLSLTGVEDALLEPPYSYQREGGAIGQLHAVAAKMGALRTYAGATPRRGDIVQVGPYRGQPRGQHIYTTVDDDGSSVDGGQSRPAAEGGSWGGGSDVRAVARTWHVDGGRLWTRSGSGERPVLWWADADALRYTRSVLMPVRG